MNVEVVPFLKTSSGGICFLNPFVKGDGEYELYVAVGNRKAVTEMGTAAIAFLDSRLESV